jgi:hypothetical protein
MLFDINFGNVCCLYAGKGNSILLKRRMMKRRTEGSMWRTAHKIQIIGEGCLTYNDHRPMKRSPRLGSEIG